MTATELVEIVDDPASRARHGAQAVTELFLQRILDRSPATHAVITPCPLQALADAARVDDARAAGRRLPLDGLPVVVKDNIDVAGVRSTCGSKFFADRIASEDATVVRLLRESGVVILGKSQSTEFMFALAVHPMYEPCCNVWDPERIPGASSSGTGCAVADDEAIAGLGSDTGGSVRIPATFSGVTGLRPTFGVISNHGVFPLARSLDTVGPIARSAVDVASLFEVLARYDDRDNRSVPFAPTPPVDLARLRIGIPRQFFFDSCDQQIEARVRAAIAGFSAGGARIVDIDLPLAYAAHEGFTLLIRAEALAVHSDRLAERPLDFSVDVRKRLQLGEQLTGCDVALVIEDMQSWRRQLQQTFAEQVDVIMTPTAQCLPPKLVDAKLGNLPDVTRLTYPWSFGHVPAISVPCGFTDDQLPVGLQIVSQPHGDRLTLAVAQRYQIETDWHRARPTR